MARLVGQAGAARAAGNLPGVQGAMGGSQRLGWVGALLKLHSILCSWHSCRELPGIPGGYEIQLGLAIRIPAPGRNHIFSAPLRFASNCASPNFLLLSAAIMLLTCLACQALVLLEPP